MRPSIEKHDFQVKVRNGMRFCGTETKSKLLLFLRKEITHPEIARCFAINLLKNCNSMPM